MGHTARTGLILGGSDFIRITPLTGSATAPTGFGTNIDLPCVTAMKPKYLGSVSADAKAETIKKELANGTIFQVDKKTVTVDPVSQSEVAAESTTSYDSITGTVLVTAAEQDTLLGYLRNSASSPVVVSISRGRNNSTFAPVGYAHMMGNITGDMEMDLGKEDFTELSLTFTGKAIACASPITYTSFNTAVTSPQVTPAGLQGGEVALSMVAITSDNLTALKTGKIVNTIVT